MILTLIHENEEYSLSINNVDLKQFGITVEEVNFTFSNPDLIHQLGRIVPDIINLIDDIQITITTTEDL